MKLEGGLVSQFKSIIWKIWISVFFLGGTVKDAKNVQVSWRIWFLQYANLLEKATNPSESRRSPLQTVIGFKKTRSEYIQIVTDMKVHPT